MAYIGKSVSTVFSAAAKKDVFTGDGSTTAFDLANIVPAGGQNSLAVFIDNVRQEPGTGKAFTLGNDGNGDLTRITFSEAPPNASEIYVLTPFEATNIKNVSDDSISTVKIQDDAVTAAKINDNVVTGQTELAETPADADVFLIYDTDASTLKKVQKQYITPTLTYTSGTDTGDGSTTGFTISSGRSVNDVLVYVNGFNLVPTTDYTISGTTLTFTTAPASGAEIAYRYLPLSGTATYTNGTETGDGSTTGFTINSGRTVEDIIVTVNGVTLVPSDDYSISGTTLTFVSAPASSAEISIRYLRLT